MKRVRANVPLERLRSVWQAMKSRCANPKVSSYPRYGGRGITVCERWQQSFQAFLEDMGFPQPGMSLDRIDNDKGYEPSNCRWATRKQQVDNSTRPRMLTVNGETLSVVDWARRLGVHTSRIYTRLWRGLTPEAALNLPCHARSKGRATECKKGHPLSMRKDGSQRCNICKAEYQRTTTLERTVARLGKA